MQLRKFSGLLMGFVLVLSVALPAWSAEVEIVKLTVEEESGVDRVSEPITMGVPLPQGKVDNAARLELLDAAGKKIPCQIREVARWLDGKSVKWVHLTWLQSLQAGEKTQVKVVLRDTPAAPQKTSLQAVERDNIVTVETGFVKFVVRGSKFNGFDAGWFDPTGRNQFNDANQVIAAAGNVTAGSSVKSEGKTYLSTADAEGEVVIEEQGTRRVVVKATGRHLAESGKMFDYIVRFYAYADSPIVRVSHTFVAAQGTKVADMDFMEALNFDILTRLAGGKVTVGTEAEPVSAEAAAQILQDTSDSFRVSAGDRVLAGGKGKSTKPLSTGWLDLSRGNLGLAVGVKWFWQMYPKSLAVASDGSIRVGLYPEGSEPFEVYMGQSRTHYLTFLFHDGKAKPQALNAVFAAGQRPLRAWAPPKYYCRDTHCFGYVVEDDPQLFGEDWPKVQEHNRIIKASLEGLLKVIDGHTYGAITRDSYGLYAWGDRYHWSWGSWKNSPRQTLNWKMSWAGNYYDHPHSMMMQFMRTGDKLFLERYWPNAIQIGDVHTVNYHPNSELIGACRYCPPRNFVAMDDGSPYLSIEYNHYKTQSVFAHYYLTGDLRSLEHCRMLANVAYANHRADTGWAARGVGHHITGLWNAYELWREPKYLERMKDMAYRAMAQFKRGGYEKGGLFMWGIANEGLCYYYWVTGDPQVIHVLRSGIERMGDRAAGNANLGLGLAMMYRVTGEKKYADLAWQAIARKKVTTRVHDGGIVFRNTHFALFFLSEASKNWTPVGGQTALDAATKVIGKGPGIPVPTTAAPVTVDGRLDDAAWSQAVQMGDFVSTSGKKAPVQSKVMVAYDKQCLYLAFVGDEPNTARLKITATERDGNVFQDDSIEVYIDPANQKGREFIGLFLNAGNVQYDRNRSQAGAWNGKWDSAVSINDGESWVVELAIPWQTLGVTPEMGHKFGLMIARSHHAGRTRANLSFLADCFGDAKSTASYPVLVLQ